MGVLGDIADFGKDVVEDRDKWADRLKKVGHLIERNAKGDKLEQVAKVGRKLGDFSRKFTDFFESGPGKRLIKSAKSPILAAGQHVIDGMKLTTGVGDPDNGERFGRGADRLGEAGTTLSAAFPDDNWDSSGSGAYTGRNNEQVSRTQTMVGVDQLVASVLSREAGQIAATRQNLDSQSDWLGDMSLITMATGLIPYVGKAAQVAAEIAMVAKAVGESGNQLTTMQHNASANAAELHGAVSRYSAVAQTAEPTGADGEFSTAPASGEDPDNAPRAPGEEDAPAPGGPGVPPAGGGGGPATGGASSGGVPSGGAGGPLPSPPAPSPPAMAGMSTTPQPAGMGSGADMAGVMAGAMGSVLGSLGGMLGGIVQAAAQAAQVATQTATQAAQTAGSSQDPTALDPTAEDADKADELQKPATDREDDTAGKDDEDTGRKPGDDAAGDEKPAPASGEENDAGPAKTLPPDLQAAAAGGGGAGHAPVYVEANFEQRQLRTPETVKLDPGIPGSAAVARA